VNIKEIRESGMLEYYVLGLLSEQDAQKVEGFLVQYPELRFDHLEIQKSLQEYAKSEGVAPKRNLEKDIIKLIEAKGAKNLKPNNSGANTPSKNNIASNSSDSRWFKNVLLFSLGALTAFSVWFAFDKNNDFDRLQREYEALEATCDSIQIYQDQKIKLYDELNNPNGKALEITPTDTYKKTSIIFHYNPIDKKNFIQIKNLPVIATNQAYQLWSLKDGVDPIPLTVFNQENGFIVPVDFEEGTGTYAITIEDEKGATVPTLTRLIGTVSVA
jgi:hypothetical protein